MAESLIDYGGLLQRALLDLVRQVLREVAAEGLPGEHHLFLTFRTDEPGVEMPEGLRREHPEEMTIVLQHQFWDLEVEDDRFAVTLRFGGQPQRLTLPFTALRGFLDPEAEFGLKLGTSTEEQAAEGTAPEPVAGSGEGETTPATVLKFAPRRDRES